MVCHGSTSSSQGKLWKIQSFRYHSTVSWIIQDTVMVMMVVNDRKLQLQLQVELELTVILTADRASDRRF